MNDRPQHCPRSSGPRRAWPVVVAAWLAFASPGGTVAVDAQTSFDALLARFHRVPGFRARFHETKRVALLRRPIETEGTLHFAPPARLARHVRGAAWSSIVVDGNRLELTTASENRRLEVAQSGAARPFLEGLIGLLSGDRRALDRSFVVTFNDGDTWQMRLSPRVAGPIRELTIHGDGVVIAGWRIVETSGDVTEVTLRDVDVTRAYSAAEARRTFRAQGP